MNWSVSGALMGWALAGVILTGCQSPTSQPPAPAYSSTTAHSTRASSGEDEATLRRRAEAHAHYAAGVIHDMNGQSDEAAAEFVLAAKNDPLNEELIVDLSRRLLRNKNPAKALEIAQPAADAPGASAELLTQVAFICAQLERYPEAITLNRRALKQRPDSFGALQSLYVNYLQSKQPEQALAVLDDAARQPKARGSFLLEISELYAMYALQFPTQREAVNAKALAALGRVEAEKLASPQQRLKLADRYYALGESKRAAGLYQGLLGEFADTPRVREGLRGRLAEIYVHAKDRPRAIEQLEAMVRENPADEMAYYLLGNLAYEAREWTNAVGYLQKAVLFGPRIEQAHYDLAAAQIALDRTEDALLTLAGARKRFRANFLVEYLSGMAYSQRKDYAQAIRNFTAAEVMAQSTDSSRLNHAFYFQFGAACERGGDREQAVAYFEKCLKLAPDFAEALNYLGYMWAERGENLEKARDLITRALKAEPDNAAYLDSMGWVLYKLNQASEALGYLLQAVKADEKPDATVYDHLGDIYETLKEPAKAREAWEKSVSLEPNEAVKKKLEATTGK